MVLGTPFERKNKLKLKDHRFLPLACAICKKIGILAKQANPFRRIHIYQRLRFIENFTMTISQRGIKTMNTFLKLGVSALLYVLVSADQLSLT